MDLGASLAKARTLRLVLLVAVVASLGIVGSASAAGPITFVGGPTLVTVEATGPGGATVSFGWPTAYDDDGSVGVSCNPPNSFTIPIGPFPGGCVAGNSDGPAFYYFDIEVVDTTPPTFDSFDPLGPYEATGPDGAAPTWDLPTATDLVDTDVEVTCNPGPGETLSLGYNYVECVAEDDYGNTNEAVYVAYVDDNTPPTIDPMSNIGPIEISDPAGEWVTWTDPTASDIVDQDVSVSCSPSSGSLFYLGIQSVYCTATDDYANNAYSFFEVEVVDTTGPVFSNIPNLGTIEVTDGSGALVEFDSPDAIDAGSGDVGSLCDLSSGYYGPGQYTVDCQAFDARSNYSYTSFSFEVVDTTPPTIHDVPTSPLQVEAPTNSGIAVDFVFIFASDLYDQDVDVYCNPQSGSLFFPGTTQVTCTAEDDEGNESEAIFDVQVTLPNDNTPPVISGVPTDFDALASGPSGGTVTYTAPTANDAIYGPVSVNCTPSSGSLFSLGTTNVSCSAEDGSGNSSSASFNVTVFEPLDIAPQITAGFRHTCTLSSAGQVSCFGWNVVGQLGPGAGASYSTPTPTPVALGGPAIAVAAGDSHTCVLMATGSVKCFGWNPYGQLGSSIGGGSGDAHPIPVTVDLDAETAVSIAAGEDTTCAVIDDGALKCWGNNLYGQTGSATNVGTTAFNPDPSAVDLGGAAVTDVSIGSAQTCALLASGNVSCWGRNQYGELMRASGFGTTTPDPVPVLADFDGEAVEVDAGSGFTCVRLTSGEVRCAGTNSVGRLANAASPGGYQPVSAELGGAASQLDLGSAHGCFVLTDASVRCAGSNSNGQLASATNLGGSTVGQSAQLADFGGPVFEVAAGWLHTCAILTDGTVRCAGENANGQLGNTTLYGESGVGTAVALPTSQFLGDPVGPVLSGIPADITTEATSSSGAAVTFSLPAAIDAVDGAVSVTCSPASGSTFAIGTTPVTCSAQDAAGHATSDSFEVTVEDTTGPVLSGVPTGITEEATSANGAVVTYILPTALDAVDGSVTVTCTPASGATFALGTTTVTCTAEDALAHESSASFDVTAEDTTNPVFDAYPSSQIVDATGQISPLGYAMPTATDLVDSNVSVGCDIPPSSTFWIPTSQIITCTATDDAGNEATILFSVYVNDYSDPVWSDLPTNQSVEATSSAGAVVAYSLPTVNDVVDGPRLVTCLPASGSTFALGTTRVDCESEDLSNNTAEHEFWITVEDTTAPSFSSTPDDITIEATGPLGEPATLPLLSASDIVDGNIPVDCDGPVGPLVVGTYTYTCTAEDTRGNSAEVQFDVNVVDTTPPVISGVPADISTPASSAAGAGVTYAQPTASDIVDGNVPVFCSPPPGSLFAVGTTIVTCTATDSRGQATSSSFKVVVDPQVIDLSETFRIVSAKLKGKRRLSVVVDVPAAGRLDVIATERRVRKSAKSSKLTPGPGRDSYGRAVLELEKSGRTTVSLRISARTAKLIKQKRKPLLRVTARFKLPTGEVKHRVVFVRLK